MGDGAKASGPGGSRPDVFGALHIASRRHLLRRTIRLVRGRGRRWPCQKPDSSAEGLQGVFEPQRAEHIRPAMRAAVKGVC